MSRVGPHHLSVRPHSFATRDLPSIRMSTLDQRRSAVVRCEVLRQHDRRLLAAAQATLTIVDPR